MDDVKAIAELMANCMPIEFAWTPRKMSSGAIVKGLSILIKFVFILGVRLVALLGFFRFVLLVMVVWVGVILMAGAPGVLNSLLVITIVSVMTIGLLSYRSLMMAMASGSASSRK